jgi:ATP-dependent protease ClpP protease subunit
MKRGFITNKKGDEAEILIYEEIGQNWWSESGIGAKQFAEDLKALGPVKVLNIRINSPGGDVFEGSAIKTQLENHPATKNVFIDGLAASAASYIAMAGNRIEISPNAMFMIHNASGGVLGNAEDMRKMAGLLEKIDGTIAEMYQRRTNAALSDIQDWMKAETWFTAEEAVKNGFADAVMANDSEAEPAAIFNLDRFRNAPKVAAAARNDAAFVVDQEYRFKKLQLLKARAS